jgi:hypothetical protein
MAVATRGARRNAAFGALNRELVWQGVTELLLVLAPFVDLRRVAALAKRWLGAAVPAATPHATVEARARAVDEARARTCRFG